MEVTCGEMSPMTEASCDSSGLRKVQDGYKTGAGLRSAGGSERQGRGEGTHALGLHTDVQDGRLYMLMDR